jgi:hypothetical protein
MKAAALIDTRDYDSGGRYQDDVGIHLAGPLPSTVKHRRLVRALIAQLGELIDEPKADEEVID